MDLNIRYFIVFYQLFNKGVIQLQENEYIAVSVKNGNFLNFLQLKKDILKINRANENTKIVILSVMELSENDIRDFNYGKNIKIIKQNIKRS